MSKHSRTISTLRTTIDCLPQATRIAMLEGIRSHPIVVGAYTDGRGGICPMLAAHRHGGRTDFLAFAQSWDRFTGARRTRRATERELRVLVCELEASLFADESLDLSGAIAEHRRLAARHARSEPAAQGREFADIRARRLRPANALRERSRLRAQARATQLLEHAADGPLAQAEIEAALVGSR